MDQQLYNILSYFGLQERYSTFVVQKNKRLYKLLDDRRGDNYFGNLLLCHYARSKEIYCRKLLCEKLMAFVMGSQLTSAKPFHLEREDFLALAEEIIEIFPTERALVYYEQSYSKKDQNNSIKCAAKGPLQNAYNNYRANLQQFSYLKESVPIQAKRSNIQKALTGTYDISILKKSHINSEEDIEEAKRVWALSYGVRRKDELGKLKGSAIIKEFPLLQTKLAPYMIEYDFVKKLFELKDAQNISLETKDRLKNNWPLLVKKVLYWIINLTVANPKTKGLCEKVEKFYVQDIVERNIPFINDVHRSNVCLALLPGLFKPANKSAAGSTKWRPTIQEKADSFFVNLQSHEDLAATIKKKIKENSDHQLPQSQSYLVLCGPLKEITCYHIVIDDKVVDEVSAVDALDTCYKAFFALNIPYTQTSQNIWTFVQKYLYELPASGKKTFNQLSLTTVITELDKIEIARCEPFLLQYSANNQANHLSPAETPLPMQVDSLSPSDRPVSTGNSPMLSPVPPNVNVISENSSEASR